MYAKPEIPRVSTSTAQRSASSCSHTSQPYYAPNSSSQSDVYLLASRYTGLSCIHARSKCSAPRLLLPLRTHLLPIPHWVPWFCASGSILIHSVHMTATHFCSTSRTEQIVVPPTGECEPGLFRSLYLIGRMCGRQIALQLCIFRLWDAGELTTVDQ
jgi:hypothetical protein